MIVIDRNALWSLELAWLVALLAELGHERAIIAREYLHSMVTAINDEQETSMMIEHQASRKGERAISIALLLGANRELESSVTIKRIVVHLFQVHLSQRQRDDPSSKLLTPKMEIQTTHPLTRHETREGH